MMRALTISPTLSNSSRSQAWSTLKLSRPTKTDRAATSSGVSGAPELGWISETWMPGSFVSMSRSVEAKRCDAGRAIRSEWADADSHRRAGALFGAAS